MNTEITSILSTLSHCSQALFAARADVEEGTPISANGSEWRWNDVSCKLPEKLVATLRQLKRILVNERNTVSAFREDQRERKEDSYGSRAEASVHAPKNADSEYQEKIHRNRFDFLHRCQILCAEIFPLVEICSNELWLANAEGEMYAGEVKIDRCASLLRNAMRLLVAITTLSEDTAFQVEERRVIEEESLLALITTGNLCAVLRHASKLLIRHFESEMPENDCEHVDMTFRYVTNIANIACGDNIHTSMKRRFMEAFYDSGGIEFVILIIKTNTMRSHQSPVKVAWNGLIVRLLASIFGLMPTASQWCIISKEIMAGVESDADPTLVTGAAGKSPTARPPIGNTGVLPRSMTKNLLTRASTATGEAQLCEYGAERDLSRLYALDARKRQKFRKGAKRALSSDAPNNQQGIAAGQSVTRDFHTLHRFEHILGRIMDAFLETCFEDWIGDIWPVAYRWSTVSDDGTEKAQEREALAFDNPCPTLIADLFVTLGAVLEAARENFLYMRANEGLFMGNEEVDEKRHAFQRRLEATMRLFWGDTLAGTDTEAFDGPQDGSDETRGADSGKRLLIRLTPTALKITSAVHRRRLKHEMLVMLRFLFQSFRTVMTFSQWVPSKWFSLVINDGGLWGKTEMILHLASASIGSVDGKYLNTLLPFLHVAILLMGRHDPVEGESAAVLTVASDPKNLWPYIAALEYWEVNPVETNRAIQYLFYQMVNLRCHGPLLNVHVLFALYDILAKSEKSIGRTQEMHRFALAMVRPIILAIKAVGNTKALPRLLFTLSSSAWSEVTTVASSVPIGDDGDDRDVYVDAPPLETADGEEAHENAEPVVSPKKTPKIPNKDRILMKEAKRKLRPAKVKTKKRVKSAEKEVHNDGFVVTDDDNSGSTGGYTSEESYSTHHSQEGEAHNPIVNAHEVIQRISETLAKWKKDHVVRE